MSYDREKTQLQETGRVSMTGLSVAALQEIINDLGIDPQCVVIRDGEACVEVPIPSGPQPFMYYLHDMSSSAERREHMESKGVRLSEEAWENVGRPFEEVGLECEVTMDGRVRIKGVR